MARSRTRPRIDGGDVAIPPFQAFLEEHRTLVYRFLVASVGPNEADDCFQETFLAALRAYPNLKDASNLRGWVLTIATRKALDAGRRRTRAPVPTEDIDRLAERRASAHREILDGDDPLWRAVRALPPRQRAAVVHRVVLDQPYSTIALAMESSEETARANVHQGLKKLREGWRER